MDKERLVQNIHLSLRGLNSGRGHWEKVRQGLERMEVDELVELNQLVLSIQSELQVRRIDCSGYYFGR